MADPWEQLHQDIAGCRRCGLCGHIRDKVPGQGDKNARLMLIGEGPGADEDAQGLAFVGAAGQLLTRELKAIGLEREQVYICNVVKCRPPQNRVPLPEEAEACMPYLKRQLDLVRPRVVILLGSTAAKAFFGPQTRITAVRGKWFMKDDIYWMPTFHPAALLRDETKKRPVWEDLKAVRRMLDRMERSAAGKEAPDGERNG